MGNSRASQPTHKPPNRILKNILHTIIDLNKQAQIIAFLAGD